MKTHKPNMQLKQIAIHEDKSLPIFASVECQQMLEMYEDFYPKIGYQPPWVGYYVIRENQIVGSCGFASLPIAGKVEIAYWTYQPFEGQGIATFACKSLVEIAKNEVAYITVIAKTMPEENASTKILRNNGFAYVEVVQDHEIGDAWLWKL